MRRDVQNWRSGVSWLWLVYSPKRLAAFAEGEDACALILWSDWYGDCAEKVWQWNRIQLEGVRLRLMGTHRRQVVGGWAVGYDADEMTYIVYLMAQVVVVTRCVGLEGESGR